jgi:hypothetical protein
MTIPMLPWIGQNWRRTHKTLILGESWYGGGTIEAIVTAWICRRERDYFLSRVFNACSGLRTESATLAERQAFWDSVAFQNFVCWSLGKGSKCRPTAADYQHACKHLEHLLAELRPAGVWVLGKEQAEYSVPVLEHRSAVYEWAYHPCARRRAGSHSLRDSWRRLQQRLGNRCDDLAA